MIAWPLADQQIIANNQPVNASRLTDRMKVKMVILLFSVLMISSLKQGSAVVPPYKYVQENVALRGKATQSALLSGENAAFSHADHAIDGNRDSIFRHGSCFHTSNDNPWWRVDLLKTYKITSVTITNRGDCCAERISGAQIHIGSSLENDGINNPQCSTITSMSTGETRTFHCAQPMYGRYVVIHLPKAEYLHLCEVEVNALVPSQESCVG
ncbi:hypothetical protein GJAV_G00137260 [Gymnothorax javanicus]|nr:hypothetical protein GJAV_G00137260 [Gymnothorax javanicus]